jgi:hypothetical protein
MVEYQGGAVFATYIHSRGRCRIREASLAQAEEPQDHTENGPPGPIVLAINICDTVIRDEMTKKVSLIGLFGVIWAAKFPCRHPLMYIHVALTGGHGKQDMEIRLVRVADNQPIAGAKGSVDFPDPLQVAELALAWINVGFEKPGEYAVEVYCANSTVAASSRKFNVVLADQGLTRFKGEET